MENPVSEWFKGKDGPTAKIYAAFTINENSTDAEKAYAFDKMVSSLCNYFSLYELTEFADWLSPDDEDAEDVE